MKYLLVAINAKYIHSNLAVYSLKAYAEKYGNNDNQISIAEYTINQYADEIVRDIYEKRPDAIGFSCYIWNIAMIREVVANYKKVCPDVDIWVGGPEASYNAIELLEQNEKIDYVICGEGEKILTNVLNHYKNNKIDSSSLKEIKGIAYRDDGKVIVNPCEAPLDLSTVPFVYKDMKEFENKIIYYETSRGCPFSCSYCLSSIDKKLRFRDLELVKKELKFFIDNNTAQVKFVDRTFNCNKKHAMEIWKFIKENDNGITNFHFEIAADLITDDEIELIKQMRPGLIQLEIGVQSTNEKTLEYINRKTDISKIHNVTAKIKSGKNIHQHLDLIAGLPFEDYKSFGKSFNDVYAMEPDQLQLGFLKVLYGSMMKNKTDEYGLVHSDNPPYEVLKTNWITYDEILKLKNIEEVVEIYYNSFQFENTIKRLVKCFDTAFEMFEKLGAYYKKNSPNGEKHARVTRYEILLGFIEENNLKNKIFNDSLYKNEEIDDKWLNDLSWNELLTLDFYLRENAKSRPPFSADISMRKKEIRQFYKSEIAEKVLSDYSRYDSKQKEKMTHMEVFGINMGKEYYVLFDYKNRNPLNKQARIVRFELGENDAEGLRKC